MHGRVATEDGAKFGSIEKLYRGQTAPQRPNLGAPVGRGIASRQQQGRAPGPNLGANLLEPHDRLTGAARQPDGVQAATDQ